MVTHREYDNPLVNNTLICWGLCHFFPFGHYHLLGVILPNLLGILIIHNESYQAIIVKWNLRMEYYTLWNIDSIVLKCSSRYWIIYPSNFGFLTNWRIIPIVQKLVGHLVILVMTGLVTHFLASYSLM